MYCQVVYLRGCHPGRIRHALAELPETLDETYERTLREINKADWELANRLFQCVAVASRPLRVEELAEFLAFDFKTGQIPKFREDWRLEDPLEAVISTCSTLLALVDVGDSPVIQFSHFSVKEFLTSSRFAEKRDAISCRYHISMTPAHTLIAQTCLGILLYLDKNITRDSLVNFPLAEYAAENWVKHARFQGVSQSAEEGMKQLFDPSKSHLAVWVWIHDPNFRWRRYERVEKPLRPRGTPLHYAAFCGLHTVVEFLVNEHSQNVHSLAVDDDSTPLHLASRAGHVEVARFLVEHGADATAQDEDGSTPLHRVSEDGHVEVARVLVEHGADVTTQNKNGWTPLHEATVRGSVDIARFLVEHGADASAQKEHGTTPLHHASFYGHVDLAQLLVDYGADVTASDKGGSTPLHRASRNGHVRLAWLLVEHGANAMAQDNDGSTPLHPWR